MSQEPLDLLGRREGLFGKNMQNSESNEMSRPLPKSDHVSGTQNRIRELEDCLLGTSGTWGTCGPWSWVSVGGNADVVDVYAPNLKTHSDKNYSSGKKDKKGPIFLGAP